MCVLRDFIDNFQKRNISQQKHLTATYSIDTAHHIGAKNKRNIAIYKNIAGYKNVTRNVCSIKCHKRVLVAFFLSYFVVYYFTR